MNHQLRTAESELELISLERISRSSAPGEYFEFGTALFWFNYLQLMNEAEYLMKNYGDRGGCYGLGG